MTSTTAASSSEEALKDRIREGGFAVALSGGGHRAALATLGALLALVDRRLGPKLLQVASVSGGSITNAFVAQRARLERLGPGELDPVATELAALIVHKGVLTRPWIGLLIIVPLLLGLAAHGIVRAVIPFAPSLAVVIGCAVLVWALLARGIAVEWLLDLRYFRIDPRRPRRERAPLSSLSGRDVDHVICMTDLVLGLPVYVSSQHGGFVWRRLKPEGRCANDVPPFHTFDASGASLAAVVRASAAFPGIPPRRLRIPADPSVPLVADVPSVAFLADGGIWNNLGTQVLREDRFIGIHATWSNGVLRPYGPAPPSIPLLCINGSAALRPTKAWLFGIPGVALSRSLLQVTQILSANTVLPRIAAINRALRRRLWTGQRADHLDPLDIVVDLRPTEDLADDLRAGAWKVDLIRASDPAVKKWESSAISRLNIAREHTLQRSDSTWAYVLGDPRPQGAYPVPGFANIEDWDAVRRSKVWKQLVEEYGVGTVTAPTTLGRLDPVLARCLIARAYLNTYLASLFLAPLEDGDVDRLALLPARLRQIVGAGPHAAVDSRPPRHEAPRPPVAPTQLS